MTRLAKLTILVGILCVSSTAIAQINVMGEPGYGTYTLNSGFSPDPYPVTVTAGGSTAASSLTTAAGTSCNAGNIANVPDVRVHYTAGSLPLRFYVDNEGTDTTIAVNTPDGQWFCNDDFSGLQPAIDFAAPTTGQYDVFVGTFSTGEFPQVQLQVTELPSVHGPGQAAAPTGGVDLAGTPTFGEYTLNSGFAPDPTTYAVTAGGDAMASTVSAACNAGYIASVPDVRVHYSAGTFPLRFYVDTPGTDTTLAVNAPDGTWHCIDDSVGLHPVIDFASPASGAYDVFVGTFSQGSYPNVNLSVTELPGSNGPTP